MTSKYSSQKINIVYGFTIIELLVVIGIIAILAMITAPFLMDTVNKQKLRGEAQILSSFMQKARLTAASTQKPIRVVVNCKKNCILITQAAQYSEGKVQKWLDLPGSKHEFEGSITVIPSQPEGAKPDGGKTPANVYWAIFMPKGDVFSNPRPFNIFIYDKAQTNNQKISGWNFVVDSYSGRSSFSKQEQNNAQKKQSNK